MMNRYLCEGPGSKETDASCQILQSLEVCFNDGFDLVWTSCQGICNGKLVTEPDGNRCLDHCSKYVISHCEIRSPTTPSTPTTDSDFPITRSYLTPTSFHSTDPNIGTIVTCTVLGVILVVGMIYASLKYKHQISKRIKACKLSRRRGDLHGAENGDGNNGNEMAPLAENQEEATVKEALRTFPPTDDLQDSAVNHNNGADAGAI